MGVTTGNSSFVRFIPLLIRTVQVSGIKPTVRNRLYHIILKLWPSLNFSVYQVGRLPTNLQQETRRHRDLGPTCSVVVLLTFVNKFYFQ